MSMLQIKCPCGQMLQVGRDLMGRKCKCPTCGRELLVQTPRQPTTPQPAVQQPVRQQPPRRPAPDPLATSSTTSMPSRPRAATPAAKPRRQQVQSNRTFRIVLFAGLASLLVCGIVGAGAWMFFRGGVGVGGEATGEVAEQFEPVATTEQVTPSSDGSPTPVAAGGSSDPLIRAAQKFVDLASLANSRGAVGLMDQEAFEQRVRGPDGSADAISNNIPTKKILSNFSGRSLAGTPANGSLQHWKVLGKTKFNGQDAVLVRYYVEVHPPARWIRTDEMLGSLIPLISTDEYWEATGKLDLVSPLTDGNFKLSVPQKPDANGLLFPRVGYMLLFFDATQGQPKLVDLASAISRLTLSRTSGELYLRDWDVIVIGKRGTSDVAAKPLTTTIFGELGPQGLNEANSMNSMADFRHYVDPYAKKPASTGVPDLPPEKRTNRTYRLKDIGDHLSTASPRLAERLADFRRDFPGDLGADMVVVCLTMVKQNTEIKEGTEAAIVDSAKRIGKQFGDPFMLYVQWVVARAKDDTSTMAILQKELKANRLETAEMHRYQLEQAIAAKDAQQVKLALTNLTSYWDPSNKLSTPELSKTVEQRWGYLGQRQEMESEAVAQGRRPGSVGRFGPMGRGPIADRSRPGPTDRVPQNSGPPRTPGGPTTRPPFGGPTTGSPFGGRPPFDSQRGRPGPPGPPSMQVAPENAVVISIDAESSFDIDALAKSLQSKLKATGYGASRRNNQGTITMHYSGTLESVKEAIDFGEAEIEKGDGRKIRVRLTQ